MVSKDKAGLRETLKETVIVQHSDVDMNTQVLLQVNVCEEKSTYPFSFIQELFGVAAV